MDNTDKSMTIAPNDYHGIYGIPKTFKLFDMDWTVEFVESLGDVSSDTDGLCIPYKSLIKLLIPKRGENRDYIQCLFYHELIHAFSFTCDNTNLYNDEHFSELFGKCLNQFNNTRK